MKKRIISLIITLVLGFIAYYIFLPAFNVSSFGFWIFILFIVAIYCACNLLFSIDLVTGQIFKLVPEVKIFGFASAFIFVFILLFNFVLSPIFNSKSYRNRIIVDSSTEFSSDIKEVDFNSLPLSFTNI